MYSIDAIEISRNYTKPGYGSVKLCRDLLVTVSNNESTAFDIYNVTCSVSDSFTVRIESISRVYGDGDTTTQWTPVDEVVNDLIDEYYNS